MSRVCLPAILLSLIAAPALADDTKSALPPVGGASPGHQAGADPAEGEQMVQEDLQTKMEVLRKGPFSLSIGGMIQVQGAFYVGDDSNITAHHDPMDSEGFRVRRARIGFGGDLARHFRYYLAIDLKDTVLAASGGDHGSELLDAKVSWERFPFLRVSAGVDKVPFSLYALQSSSKLELMERPLTTQLIAPDRRVGITVAGDVWRLQYAAGLYNGSTGVTSGNQMAGMAVGGQLMFNVLGKPNRFVPGPLRVAVGGGYMFDNGEAVDFHRISGALDVRVFRIRLMGELLWESSTPDAVPMGVAEAGEVQRWGAAGDLSVFVWRELIQVALRYEYLVDNEQLQTFGKLQLFTGGVNVYLYQHRLKLNVNYTHRAELDGSAWDNDIAYAQIQAMF